MSGQAASPDSGGGTSRPSLDKRQCAVSPIRCAIRSAIDAVRKPRADACKHLVGDRSLAGPYRARQTVTRPDCPGAGHPRSNPYRVLIDARRRSDPPAVGHDDARGGQRRPASERDRDWIADAAVRQQPPLAGTDHRDRREEHRDGRTRLHDFMQRDSFIRTARKVPRLVGEHIVTGDAESRYAVMERVEAGRLELPQAMRNDATTEPEGAFEPAAQAQIDTVQQQMTAAEIDRVRGELIKAQPGRGVIRRDYRAGTDADQHIDRNVFRHQPTQHPDMRRPAQSAGAEYDADPRPFTRGWTPLYRRHYFMIAEVWLPRRIRKNQRYSSSAAGLKARSA